MTVNTYNLAEDIHIKVNRSTSYMMDAEQYGVPEYWTEAGKYGDCEDYALAKRAILISKGWPLNSLGLCVCKTEDGIGHCVLWVDTDKGSFILDNRRDWPISPKDLPYSWERILCNGVWSELLGWE